MKGRFMTEKGRARRHVFPLHHVLIFMVCSVVLLPHAVFAGQKETLQRLLAGQRAIRTMSADFVQEKHSTMLKEPLISKGRFLFKSPDRVLWDYDGEIIIASDGRNLTIYYPQLKEAEVVPIDRNFMKIPLSFNLEELGRFFDLSLEAKKDFYTVSLTPREKGALFSEMIITLDSAGVPLAVEMHEKGGDRSIIRFRNQKVNGTIPDSTFVMDLPEDTVVRRLK